MVRHWKATGSPVAKGLMVEIIFSANEVSGAKMKTKQLSDFENFSGF